MRYFYSIVSHTYFPHIALTVIILIAAGLRLINITTEEFWYDEILSLVISHYGTDAQEILSYVREVYHTPLYFFFSRQWTHLFGLSELSGRLFALLFSVASIPILYAFGKKLFTKEVALLSSLFMALSPLQVEFGQEARPYSLIMFLALVSMVFFWRFINDPKNKTTLAIIFIVNLIGIYTHYDYFIPIAAQLGTVLVLRFTSYFHGDKKTLFRNAVLWWGALGVAFMPWIVYSFIPNISGVDYAIRRGSVSLFSVFLEGELWFNVVGTEERLQAFLSFLGQIVVIAILIYALQRAVAAVRERKAISGTMLGIFFVVLWYAISVVFYFYSPLSAQYTPNWQRHIIIFGPAFFLLLAYGISILPKERYKVFSVSLIIISMLLPLIFVTKNDSEWSPQHQNKTMVEYIQQHEQRGDFIFVPGRLWEVVVLHYYNGMVPVGGFLPLKSFNSVTARPTYYVPAVEEVQYAYKKPPPELYVGIDEVPELVRPYKRVWLFAPTEALPIFNWFLENWKFVECFDEACGRLYLFENPQK